MLRYWSKKPGEKKRVAPLTQNSLSSMAYFHTKGLIGEGPVKPGPKPTSAKTIERRQTDRWSTAELVEFITSKTGKNPRIEAFEVELPNGIVIGGD